MEFCRNPQLELRFEPDGEPKRPLSQSSCLSAVRQLQALPCKCIAAAHTVGLVHWESLGRRQHCASKGHRGGTEVAQWVEQGALLLGSPTVLCILKQPGLLQGGGGAVPQAGPWGQA